MILIMDIPMIHFFFSTPNESYIDPSPITHKSCEPFEGAQILQ